MSAQHNVEALCRLSGPPVGIFEPGFVMSGHQSERVFVVSRSFFKSYHFANHRTRQFRWSLSPTSRVSKPCQGSAMALQRPDLVVL